MYNKELLEQLLKEFGLTNTIIFCKMEAAKNDILYKDCVGKGDDECVEYDFERDWWKSQLKELDFELKARIIN
jgi:hypothetical protein